VIYGMPKAAVDAGVVDRQVALEALADEILATL
jgi:chemotaxis response regulator CheB